MTTKPAGAESASEHNEMERFAKECIKGEPTRVPSRRERELGAMVLSLLRNLQSLTRERDRHMEAAKALNEDCKHAEADLKRLRVRIHKADHVILTLTQHDHAHISADYMAEYGGSPDNAAIDALGSEAP